MYNVQFKVSEQSLVKTGGIFTYASDTVEYIKADFTFDDSWDSYESIKAIWQNGAVTKSSPLNSRGSCTVPSEVVTDKGTVKVNLVGTTVADDVVSKRITTFQINAFTVTAKVNVDGGSSQPITPSEYEQFVASVKADADRAEAGATASANSAQSASESATASANSATSSAQSATASAQSAQDASDIAVEVEVMKNEVELAKDKVLGMRATAETLEAGSDATASYSDGLLTLGIPRGDKGEQGTQGETGATPNFSIGEVDTLEPNESATATITGTAEEPVLNLGIPKGEQGDVNLSQLEALLPTETASGEIVTITDGQSVVPAKSLKVTLEPIQEGSGTPSPTNIRPISGHTEVNTIVSPTTSAQDGTTYTTSLGQTVYGGTLDVVSGELVVDRAMVTLDGSSDEAWVAWQGCYACNHVVPSEILLNISTMQSDFYCNQYNLIGLHSTPPSTMQVGDYLLNSVKTNTWNGNISFKYDSLADLANFKTVIAQNPIQLVYPLATPQAIQLTPQEVELLTGTNNVWSDGDVEVEYKADVKLYVDKKIAELSL